MGILQFGFVISSDEVIDLSSEFGVESGSVVGSGIEFSDSSIIFTEENSYVEINGEKFENILPINYWGTPSRIEIGLNGEILSANLAVNGSGGNFSLGGKKIIAPPNSNIHYSKSRGDYLIDLNEEGGIINFGGNEFEFFKEGTLSYDYSGFNLPSGSKVRKIEFPQDIRGQNINLFDEVFLEIGECSLFEEGYSLIEGRAIYEGLKIERSSYEGKDILIAKEGVILSEDFNNFVQKNSNGIRFQSSYDEGMKVTFLEDNDFFDLNGGNLGINEERTLSMVISGGDAIEIFNFYDLNKDFTQIKHTSEGGITEIITGKHSFNLVGDSFSTELGNLNTKNKISVPFTLVSNNLKSDSLKMEDDDGYYIFDEKGNTNFAFDKNLLDSPNYDFKSSIGKEIYSFAEDQVGNSAFVWGGRGNVYYDEYENYAKKQIPVEGIKGYDCIGLAQTALVKYYGGKYSDFPPNLKLEGSLKKKGWTSYYIEPRSVNQNTEKQVNEIPAGSIVFAMHPSHKSESFDYEKDVQYNEYVNKNGEELALVIGHTLIRGKGDTNFINAIPGYGELMPKRAREYNEFLLENGEMPVFGGTVKEGELVPYGDYLLVMAPPKNN